MNIKLVKYSSFNLDKINDGEQLTRFLCDLCEKDSVCPKYKDKKGLAGALECLDFKLNEKFEVNLDSLLKFRETEHLDFKPANPECERKDRICGVLDGKDICAKKLNEGVFSLKPCVILPLGAKEFKFGDFEEEEEIYEVVNDFAVVD